MTSRAPLYNAIQHLERRKRDTTLELERIDQAHKLLTQLRAANGNGTAVAEPPEPAVRVHWTQTPAGRKRMSRIMKRRAAELRAARVAAGYEH